MDIQKHKCGSGRVKEIKNQLKRYRSLEKLKGYDFKSTLRSIKGEYSMGELKKATIYKQNYLKMIKQQFSGYDHYEELVSYIESFSNPIDFWNAVKNNEKFNDITFMYDEVTTQNKLNSLLDNMKIINLKKQKIAGVQKPESKVFRKYNFSSMASGKDTKKHYKSFGFTPYK